MSSSGTGSSKTPQLSHVGECVPEEAGVEL